MANAVANIEYSVNEEAYSACDYARAQLAQLFP